ncbi:hypothetical protein AB3331_02545 [Streptococcus sp. H49]|uniref:hypothetical protein n=1 Tax=Streptococcus huangxiaojuni TaxID=3237239 RepID=UPI0034A1A64F
MKYVTYFIIPWLSTMGLLWFVMPPSHPSWIKPLALSIVMLLQTVCFFIMLKLRVLDGTKEQQKRYFGLTEKLYTVTILTASAIYVKGIWVLSPASNPVWIKHLFLGLALLVLVGLALYFAFKKVDEYPDDRFYANLAKAASLTLLLMLVSLMVLSLVTFFVPFVLTAGMVLVFGAAMVLIFDIAFYAFEKRGG